MLFGRYVEVMLHVMCMLHWSTSSRVEQTVFLHVSITCRNDFGGFWRLAHHSAVLALGHVMIPR